MRERDILILACKRLITKITIIAIIKITKIIIMITIYLIQLQRGLIKIIIKMNIISITERMAVHYRPPPALLQDHHHPHQDHEDQHH